MSYVECGTPESRQIKNVCFGGTSKSHDTKAPGSVDKEPTCRIALVILVNGAR